MGLASTVAMIVNAALLAVSIANAVAGHYDVAGLAALIVAQNVFYTRLR